MTPHALGESLRLANLEILEVQNEQTESVTSICQRVVKMSIGFIEEKIFKDGSPQLDLV